MNYMIQGTGSIIRILTCGVLAAACLLMAGTAAHAQTPVTTIENIGGNSVFVSFDDGGLLAPGEFNTGVIPAEGAGTRLMWYPAKAAFRAGRIDGSEWDDDNIGRYSTAIGDRTIASGVNSTAMGHTTTASGPQALAMGRNTTSSSQVSTAMGLSTTASGGVSTAMGQNTTASGPSTTAMGFGTIARSQSSLSIGEYNDANTGDDNTLLVAGNGTSSIPSDALVLDFNGNMTIAGTLAESSDRRLKKDIQPIGKDVLGKLSNINPTTFAFKNQETHPEGPQIGLIAQEVQKQFPELVSEASNGYLSVSYSKFTAVLLKGMQEQQEQIEFLKKENDMIKKRLANLEQRNQHASLVPEGSQVMVFLVLTVLLIGTFIFRIKNR